MSEYTPINGVEVGELLEFKNICTQQPDKADRNPMLVAHWEGGSRSRVEFKGMTIHLGGDGEFNPMQMFLATLAACDVDLIAMHASFLELKIESLSVEATGHFNVRSYLGLDGTPEQIAYLRERCECSSPVGDSMSRSIPLKLEFAAST